VIRRGILCVWQRNFLYFRYTLWVSTLWVIGEPLLFMYAIGYGLGGYVGEIHGVSYAEFFFPALMVASAMLVAYFESTFATFTRMTHQKTFMATLLTPIMPRDIGHGEILWAASKGFLSAVGVAIAALLHGLVDSWLILPALGVAFLMAWVFAAFGLVASTYARSYDWFTYLQTGVLMPIYFFSGTYFPLDNLPKIAQKIVWLSPLTHGVRATRMILANDWDPILMMHLGVIVAVGIWLTRLGVGRLERRLVQ
jgi:lipooligosaccharide transport system permease protein